MGDTSFILKVYEEVSSSHHLSLIGSEFVNLTSHYYTIRPIWSKLTSQRDTFKAFHLMDESVKYLHSRNFTIPLNRNHQLIFSENNSAWGLHHSTRSPPSQMLYPTYRNLAPAVAYKPNVKAICSHTHGMRPCARRVCVFQMCHRQACSCERSTASQLVAVPLRHHPHPTPFGMVPLPPLALLLHLLFSRLDIWVPFVRIILPRSSFWLLGL